jgi:hypothetical protein
MISDVDGRKPDSYKDCWRWIRTLIQDFVHLKKVSSDYQKILSKVDHLFNQSSTSVNILGTLQQPHHQTLQQSSLLYPNPTQPTLTHSQPYANILSTIEHGGAGDRGNTLSDSHYSQPLLSKDLGLLLTKSS